MEEEKSFPPEMLQMIFQWIGSRKELCSLRCVCRDWNASVISMLGERKLAVEMEWRPTEEPHTEPNSLLPKWVMKPTATKLITEVLKPNGETMMGIEAEKMELPTQSLHLVIQKPSEGKRSIPTQNDQQSVLFRNFGNSLKFLCLNGVKLNMPEFYKLLSQAKSLRALKISDVDFVVGWSFVPQGCPQVCAAKLPELQHLTLLDVDSQTTANWLIEMFAPHLQTLELSKFGFNVVNPNGFPQLKKLKLMRPFSNFLRLLVITPMVKLERLSIKHSLSTSTELLEFVAKFQGTLLELTLEYLSKPSKFETEDFTGWEPPRFHKLSRLCLVSFITKAQSKLEEQLLNSSFPLLKVLHFRNLCQMSRKAATEYSRVRNHWNVIPSLESIEWVTGLFKEKNVEIHSIPRQA